MIQLLRGDQNNLEGKLLIFSRLPIKENIFGIYASNDITNFFERMGLPKEAYNEVKRESEERVKKLKEEGFAPMSPIYMCPMDLEEHQIIQGNNDILDMGNFNKKENCFGSLKAGLELYFLRFNDQLENKHNFKERTTEKKVSYREISQEKITKYLMNNYIIKILDSYNLGRKEDAEKLRSNMIQFSKGSSFFPDISRLSKELEGYTDPETINLYMKKIKSIIDENFEEAIKYRDEIENR